MAVSLADDSEDSNSEKFSASNSEVCVIACKLSEWDVSKSAVVLYLFFLEDWKVGGEENSLELAKSQFLYDLLKSNSGLSAFHH